MGIDLYSRIGTLKASQDAELPENIKFIIERLLQNYSQSLGSLAKQFYLLFATWMASVAVGFGIVQESQIGSLKISAVKSLLLVAPMLIGFEYYLSIVALSYTQLIMQTLHGCYKEFLPTLDGLKLRELIDPPSFLGIEDFFYETANISTRRIGILNRLLSLISGVVILFGGIAIFCHVSFIAMVQSGRPIYQSIVFVAVGGLAFGRGYLLLYSTMEL